METYRSAGVSVPMKSSATDEIFEIEKKLRTGSTQVQLSALAIIPTIISSLPPLPTSTLFLRLTDHFCTHPNTRPAIVQTVRQCAGHAQRVGPHAEEITRRLGVIWESNDGRARAMVILIYGWLAEGLVMVPEAVYRIQQSLGCVFEDEYEAAVLATLRMVSFDPSKVLPLVADSILNLLDSLGIFSFLRPKIFKILSHPSGDCLLEKRIFFKLAEKVATETVFQLDLLQTLTKVSLRIESLARPCLEILSGFEFKDLQDNLLSAYPHISEGQTLLKSV